MATEQQIREFLASGHPPAHRLAEWRDEIQALGETVPSVCLDVLKRGACEDKTAAIYALRAFDYDAWAEGYRDNEHFRVRKSPTEPWSVIKPNPTEENHESKPQA